MPARSPTPAVTVLLLSLTAMSAAGAAETGIDDATGLAIAPGWELVRAHCGGCHSHRLVTSQRADRQTWLDMIRWMQETQNLWQLEPATEESILDYLAASYPPEPDRRRAPLPPTLMPPRDAAGSGGDR